MNRARTRSVALVSLFTVAAAGAVGAVACGETEDAPATGIDSGVGVNPTATNTTSPTATNTTSPPLDGSPGDASSKDASPADGAVADATSDAAADVAITCRSLLANNPALTSGVHSIDLDGPGPLPPMDAYCDMTFNGGGWTLIQSYDGKKTTGALVVDQGDAGYYNASPRPGTFGAFAGWVVKGLAEASTQVHIRWSFANDAAAAHPDSGMWITSRPTDADDPSQVILNLRDLVVLQNGTDGGFADWQGPQATASRIQWHPNVANCVNLVPVEKYPSVFWACGNFGSMNVIRTQGGHTRWHWSTPSIDPIEVYIR